MRSVRKRLLAKSAHASSSHVDCCRSVVEPSSENTGERSVLIGFGDRSRPVMFSSGSGSDKARLLAAANARNYSV